MIIARGIGCSDRVITTAVTYFCLCLLCDILIRSITVASVVGTYWFVSIAMVYLNKILMSNEGISIPAPLFVTWFQCVVTVLICWIAGLCGQCARRSNSSQYAPVSVSEDGSPANPPKPGFCAQFPKAEYLLGPAKKIFPLTLVFGENFSPLFLVMRPVSTCPANYHINRMRV